MTQYRVLNIATEEALETPHYRREPYLTDSAEFPGLQNDVLDDFDLFILDISSGETWSANEFFEMNDILEFTVTKDGVPF